MWQSRLESNYCSPSHADPVCVVGAITEDGGSEDNEICVLL